MIKANFNAYNSYVTDSLYQWDLNQTLIISGLDLSVIPEIHFDNADMDRAIVRQAVIANSGYSVVIPNSLLQIPLTIYAHIGIYDGEIFKIIETVEIPVIPKEKPFDYVIENDDEEIYSFKKLENEFENLKERVNTVIENGVHGFDGKSAYEYAKEGGYTGTELEFSLRLAAILNGLDEITIYSVTNNLTNCTTSNSATTVYDGSAYIAELSCSDDRYINMQSVTMGGVDITSTAWSQSGGRKGTITIPKVTGNIVITCDGE